MGTVLYGYEGLDMPVLFTSKGMIYLHRKTVKKKTETGVRINDTTGAEEEEEWEVTDKSISMEWVGANPAVQVLVEEPRSDYHTYGLLPHKAGLFKKLIYKELYPGIDVLYYFPENKPGFEYSIIVKPGADPSLIKMKFGGDLRKISMSEQGNLVISSAIDDILQSQPLSFTTTDNNSSASLTNRQPAGTIRSAFRVKNNTVGFSTGVYDPAQTLVLDPFVSSTSSMNGLNAGKAKDVDFDYAGNVYVTGGGHPTVEHKLAKFDAAGNLLWTFNGTLLNPDWAFGPESGGWTVDKNTGKIYLGQGFSTLGSQIIRLNAAGLYDNYQTIPNPGFKENWKMMWLCTNGAEQILIVGGGIATNNNLAFFTPSTSNTISGINITGISTYAQDISDIARDPTNNDIYTIFASLSLTQSINNKIYKHVFPYAPADIQWTRSSGYDVMVEASNRPYLSANNSDNSTNLFSVNSSYLFYWDGKNLKAFDKNTGNDAGVPASIASNQALMQGGIFADECNNVYIGSTNGLIKVYKFDGTSFDDAAAPDISITGYLNASVYDLAFDENRKLLYACGDGFVASFDITSYCNASSIFNLGISTSCPTVSAQATITPAPPASAVVTYVLYNGATQVASNTTGYFPGLSPTVTYTIKATIAQVCTQLELSKDFSLSSCITLTVNTSHTNPVCHDAANGTITATAAAGTGPYQYSIDGINFQPASLFSGLMAGTYSIVARDVLGNLGIANVTLTNPAALQVTAGVTPSSCSPASGSISASATLGTAPFQYSLNGVVFQPSGSFTSLSPGNYTVTAKDINGCTGTVPVTVGVQNTVTANAGPAVSLCAGQSALLNAGSNGTSFAWSPATGLDNPAILHPTATPSSTTTYTLTATSGFCSSSSSVTVTVKPLPLVNAGTDFNLCEGTTHRMTATSDGQRFVWTPATGLSNPNILNPVVSMATAPYTVTTYTLTATKDQCQNSASVKVTSFPAPVAHAGAGASICYGQSVQLNGSGGSAYQWRPVSFLSDYTIANPVVINPSGSITYYLTVTDANGCNSLQPDAVTINVSPPAKLFAGNDTVVAVGQPLQLMALDVNHLGFTNYSWAPSTGLNSDAVQNPVAVLSQDIMYTVTATNALGCSATDAIRINVYKGPDIYVPNAFTPNGDTKNDWLRALPVGIREFRSFTIYNRFGEKVFSTANPAVGWDGYLHGEPQAAGAYIWIAEGVDYLGRIISKKGTLVLVR
ncbi:MAG: gliding motility-associated C-terminal domain-containing protein [Ferruginibacter sp.]